MQIVILHASIVGDIDETFATIVQNRIGALVVAADSFLASRREQITTLAARHAVPAVYVNREMAGAGGLMRYGNSLADGYRRAGIHTARILKGEKPADLPVDQATKFELIINLKTAKALGLEIASIAGRRHVDLSARRPRGRSRRGRSRGSCRPSVFGHRRASSNAPTIAISLSHSRLGTVYLTASAADAARPRQQGDR